MAQLASQLIEVYEIACKQGSRYMLAISFGPAPMIAHLYRKNGEDGDHDIAPES